MNSNFSNHFSPAKGEQTGLALWREAPATDVSISSKTKLQSQEENQKHKHRAKKTIPKLVQNCPFWDMLGWGGSCSFSPFCEEQLIKPK